MNQPQFIEDLCSFIALGQWLPDFGKLHEIDFAYLWQWVECDETRVKRYRTACKARDELCHDESLQQLRAIIVAKTEKSSDRIKAIELQAKLAGRFVEHKHLTGSVTLADLVGNAQGVISGPSNAGK